MPEPDALGLIEEAMKDAVARLKTDDARRALALLPLVREVVEKAGVFALHGEGFGRKVLIDALSALEGAGKK